MKMKQMPSYGPGFEQHIARRGQSWSDVKRYWEARATRSS